MEHNAELIKEVFQNSEMSKDVLNRLIKICDDANLRAALADEFAQYHEIMCEASKVGDERNIQLKPRSRCKNAIFSGISLNAMIDKTSSHLAEMVVQGSTMGIIDMTRAVKEFSGADENVVKLAEKLLETEKNNVEKMLEFV